MLNPYAGCGGAWVRSNLHGHCSESSDCSSVPLLRGIEAHRRTGARVLALTDHDAVTDLSDARRRWPDMVFLEGFEWSKSHNLLFIGERVTPLHQLPLSEALAGCDGLLTVVCHPRPYRGRDYWTVPMILALRPAPLAIEVYNAHYSRPMRTDPAPNPLYTETWDALLTAGLRVWGLANDDSHDDGDFGHAATWVNVETLSAAAVIAAVKAGRSYASTGIQLEGVSVAGDEISVRLDSAAGGRFVGPGGRQLATRTGREFSYLTRGERYVRFEAEGPKGRIFLQPFFADGDEEASGNGPYS